MKKEKFILTLLIIFITTFLVYFISSPGETPYDYFTRLADGFTKLHLYTDEKPSWLNELIPFKGHYFVALPPMPAILMVPFVNLFGANFSETIFSIILGGLNVVLVYLLLIKIGISKSTTFLVTIFFAFGTSHWYLASVGSSWYIAHIVAIFFFLLALLEAFGKRRFFLISLFIGMSFWARTSVLFTIPFFYLYFFKDLWPFQKSLKSLKPNWPNVENLFLLHLGIVIFILLDVLYNYLRFGELSPLGPYKLIQDYDTNTVVNGVYLGIQYIPRHIDALFLRLPQFQETFPFLIPSLYATAIWFTSPLLIFILRAPKKILTLACLAAIIPTLLVVMMWAGVGFSQFGYRFALDFMPFLIILTALGIGQKPGFLAYLLLGISILVNTWGVVMVNKLNMWNMS